MLRGMVSVVRLENVMLAWEVSVVRRGVGVIWVVVVVVIWVVVVMWVVVVGGLGVGGRPVCNQNKYPPLREWWEK